jgi:hypothetical protein
VVCGHLNACHVELVELAAEVIATDSWSGRRERFRINVFIDPTSDLPATWQDGYPLPDTLRQWLWCDGSLTPTFVEQGRPVAVGPTIKGIPDRIRRLVLARDRKCRVPWCESTIGLQVHHIIHREAADPPSCRT